MAAAGNEPQVYGLPGRDFYLLHGFAMGSLGLSIIASSVVLIYLLFFASNKPIAHRQIGERLVVYLAIYDLCFSISHSLDHSYMMATLSNPPDYFCLPFAFLLHQFLLAQNLLILFTSVNAMTMVVKRKRLHLGKYDWKLFLVTLGLPAVIGVVGVSVPYLGPSGTWCFLDRRKPYAQLVDIVYGMVIVTVFIVHAICYGAVYVKTKQAEQHSNSVTQQDKYHKSAKLMLLFIAIYLFQWWPYATFAVWSLISPPPFGLLLLVPIVCNLGGLYNAIAYTIIRRKYTKVSADQTESTPVGLRALES